MFKEVNEQQGTITLWYRIIPSSKVYNKHILWFVMIQQSGKKWNVELKYKLFEMENNYVLKITNMSYVLKKGMRILKKRKTL